MSNARHSLDFECRIRAISPTFMSSYTVSDRGAAAARRKSRRPCSTFDGQQTNANATPDPAPATTASGAIFPTCVVRNSSSSRSSPLLPLPSEPARRRSCSSSSSSSANRALMPNPARSRSKDCARRSLIANVESGSFVPPNTRSSSHQILATPLRENLIFSTAPGGSSFDSEISLASSVNDMVTKLRPPIELYKPPSLRTEGDGNDQEDCLPTFKEQVQHQQTQGGTTESSGHFPGSGSRHAGDQAFGQQAKLTGHSQQQNLGQNPAASFEHQQATAIGSGGGMQPGAGPYLGQPATAGNPNAAASSAAVPMSFQSHMAMAGGAGPPLLPTPARFGLQQPRTAADFYLNNMAFYAAAAAAAGANGPHGPAVHAMPSMMPLGAAQLQLSKSTTNLAGLFPSAAVQQAQQAAQLYQPFCMAAPGLKQPSAAAGLAPRFQRNEHLFQPESLQLHQQHQQQQQQQQRQQQQARHYTSGHHTYHVVTGRLNDLGGGGGHHHQHQHHGPTTSGPAPQQQHHHQTGAGGLSLKRSKSLGAADFYKQQQHQQEALARTRSTGFLLHQLPAESREVYAEALSNPGGLSGKRLMDLAETTLTNAVGDRKLARPCAEVCASIAAREAGCTFTESLLNACREWFMRRNEKLFETPSNSAETVGQSSTARNDSTPSTPTHASSPTAGGSAEVDGGNAKNVSKWIAYAAFVAELYFQMKVVRPKRNQDQPPAPILLQILYECIYVSLKSGNLNNPQELEALELVLSSVGRDLDAEKPKKMDTVFTTIRENFLLSGDLVSASKKVLLQLVELRASGWQLSKAATVYYYVPGSGVACSGNNGTGGGVNSGCHPASPSSSSSKVPGAGSAGSDDSNGN